MKEFSEIQVRKILYPRPPGFNDMPDYTSRKLIYDSGSESLKVLYKYNDGFQTKTAERTLISINSRFHKTIH